MLNKVATVVLVTSSADTVLSRNVTFEFRYESSSDGNNETEEGTPIISNQMISNQLQQEGTNLRESTSPLADVLQSERGLFRIYFWSRNKRKRNIWPYYVQNVTYSRLISSL